MAMTPNEFGCALECIFDTSSHPENVNAAIELLSHWAQDPLIPTQQLEAIVDKKKSPNFNDIATRHPEFFILMGDCYAKLFRQKIKSSYDIMTRRLLLLFAPDQLHYARKALSLYSIPLAIENAKFWNESSRYILNISPARRSRADGEQRGKSRFSPLQTPSRRVYLEMRYSHFQVGWV